MDRQGPGVDGSVPAAPADAPDPDRFVRSIRAIDRANAADPNTLVHRGAAGPKELVHAQLMTQWLTRLDPSADEAAHLAARAHHFRRWTRPRGDHPEGRAGYLRWRASARRAHADEVAELLAAHGHPAELIDRVGRIIRKEGLGSDPAVQTHEDALCLVFLQTQLLDLAARVGDDEMVAILERTIPKMSSAGVSHAMSLELGPAGAALVQRAAGAVEDRSGR